MPPTRGAPQWCGLCRETGHTRRCCPQRQPSVVEDSTSFEEDLIPKEMIDMHDAFSSSGVTSVLIPTCSRPLPMATTKTATSAWPVVASRSDLSARSRSLHRHWRRHRLLVRSSAAAPAPRQQTLTMVASDDAQVHRRRGKAPRGRACRCADVQQRAGRSGCSVSWCLRSPTC
jgi:hypothetical protein